MTRLYSLPTMASRVHQVQQTGYLHARQCTSERIVRYFSQHTVNKCVLRQTATAHDTTAYSNKIISIDKTMEGHAI